MPLELDADVFGYGLAEGYAHGRAASFQYTPAVAGGGRYRLTDDFPVYVMDVTFDWDDAQYNAFNSFFSSINYGEDRFFATLIMAVEVPFALFAVDTVLCRLQDMYQADYRPDGRWKVAMRLELPLGTNLTGTFCDVIYGGPITMLAPDDIYAGEPDNLPPDIIVPCPAVDPQELAA